MKNVFKSILRWIALVGPGLFCLGFTIGTGSVTSMVKSGSMYGTGLLWVLAISAFFTWVMTHAYGHFGIVTGDTAIHGVKQNLKGGKVWASILIIGLVVSQWISLSSILNITSNAVKEVLYLCIPGLSESASYWIVLGMAIIIAGTIWLVLNNGNYSVFEKILSVLVTLMGLAFIISMFIELPEPGTIVRGFVPSIPSDADARLFIAAFVGTTMSSPTFVIRPMILKSKGWGKADGKLQKRDAIVSASLTFIISASIMICAAGVLRTRGIQVEKVLDMIYVLQPIAGRFAVALFVVGLLSAGLSSLFPIMMLAPELISDYKAGEMQTGTPLFKILTGIAALVGLTIPILGTNPVITQIASQVTLVFVLPLVILFMMIMINKRSVMGSKRPGIVFNILMGMALLFACVVSYTGVIALSKPIVNNKERQESMNEVADRVFSVAAQQCELLAQELDSLHTPRSFDGTKLITARPKWWCSGFFPGTLWLVYEYTGDETILALAGRETAKVEPIKLVTNDHDVGFQINCSFGQQYRITGDLHARDVMHTAAHSLATRFNPTVGCIRSWDFQKEGFSWQFPVIIDNMMNLELLMSVAAMENEPELSSAAISHANTTMKNHYRPDYTTYHLVDYNPADGSVNLKQTVQGYADDSAWARGQAWSLYGFTMMYRFTLDPAYLERAVAVADMLLSRLPEDGIPYWDFDSPKIPDDYRDASAAAVMASAFVELAGYVQDGAPYRKMAERQLRTLASEEYLAEPGTNGGFILKHSVGNMPGNSEVDVPLSYADYYFLEALSKYSASQSCAKGV